MSLQPSSDDPVSVDVARPTSEAPSITSEDRRARTEATPIAFAGLTIACAVAALIIAPGGNRDAEFLRFAVVLLFGLAGGMAVLRRPTERQGTLVLWATALGGIASVCAAIIAAHTAASASAGPALWLVSACRFVEPVALTLLPVAVMHFLLGLPDGSCLWSRRALAAGYLVGAATGIAIWTRRPDLTLWPVWVEVALAGVIGVTGSQNRYLRSKGLERRRMQWFGWALSVDAELLFVSVALRLLWGWPTRFTAVAAVACLPVAVAIALGSSKRFAGRIDRLLAHTVSLAGLTAVVLSVYIVIVVGIGRIPTRADHSLLALSMVSAAVAALLYGPARERLTQYANRLVYGEREAPDAVLRTFGSRLSRSVPMEELLLQVAESLRKTLGLAAAEVWTGSGGRLERSASVPDVPVMKLTLSAEEETVVARSGVTGTAWAGIWLPLLVAGREASAIRIAPTTHSGKVLGLIVCVRSPGSDPFTADDDSMLTELARQVALALHNVELDSALQESLDEVRRQAEQLQESRARIVAASDAARRQIERNLHDGAQQHLVALAVNLRLARRLVETDAAASAEMLDQLGAGIQDAVQELRALAHGIYPPLLVDRGVPEALRSAAGRAALPTTVIAEDLGRYTPEEEAAVYFCCMEALQNAGKHAGDGATATIRVWEEPGVLRFDASDSGRGFDASSKGLGTGFVNMNDRVGAIGGSVTVNSAPGKGTTISGRIPIGS